MNLFQAIHAVAVIDTDDFHSGEMPKAIATIQDILGQDDGGIAGVHFSGVKGNWLEMSYDERIDFLKDYVKSELAFFDGIEQEK